MQTTDRPAFDDSAAERIYAFVERRGAVDPETVRSATGLGHDEFADALVVLMRGGHLQRSGGSLQVSIDAGDEATYSRHGVEYAIRPAGQEDFEGLVKVMRRVSDEATYVVAESVAERLLHDDAVVRHNAVESRRFFVAEADGGVVGWTHVDTSPIETRRHVARQTIGVAEPYRGYGIGGRLLECGLEWAAEHGFRKLYNSLPATNEEAITFLESHGYEVEAVRPDHYLIDGEFVDEVQVAVHPAEVVEESDGPDRPVTTSWSTAERLSKASDHLRQSLDADEMAAARYHVREALQHLEFAREGFRGR